MEVTIGVFQAHYEKRFLDLATSDISWIRSTERFLLRAHSLVAGHYTITAMYANLSGLDISYR
jgi:hypothetical protein